MDGMNRVILLGNLGADPELRFTAAGQGVLNIRMATTRSWFDKEKNERKEETEWHNVTVWGGRGEGLAKVLAKGSTIAVEGRLKTTSYEKDGVKRYSTEIVAEEVCLCGGKSSQSGGASETAQVPAAAPARPAARAPF